MSEGTLTRKGQITIPKPVRDALGLTAGDKVSFDVVDGDLVGRVRHVPSVMDVFHRLPKVDPPLVDPDTEATAWRDAAVAREKERRSRE